MPRPGSEVARAAESFRLALFETPPRGVAGERLGKATGSSLEFQDRRVYAVGDDVRHLDWRAYARTDQLLVRQYREEILPRVEILLDVSRSMAVDAAKARTALDVVALLARAGVGDGFQVQIARCGDRPELVDAARFEAEDTVFDGRRPWIECLPVAASVLRRGSMRVLVSDFLFPHDAADLVRPFVAHGGGLALVQVLGADDRDPPSGAALRLVDAEDDSAREVVLDARVVARYRDRLARLTGALRSECSRSGARFAEVPAPATVDDVDRVLREACGGALLQAGILSVA